MRGAIHPRKREKLVGFFFFFVFDTLDDTWKLAIVSHHSPHSQNFSTILAQGLQNNIRWGCSSLSMTFPFSHPSSPNGQPPHFALKTHELAGIFELEQQMATQAQMNSITHMLKNDATSRPRFPRCTSCITYSTSLSYLTGYILCFTINSSYSYTFLSNPSSTNHFSRFSTFSNGGLLHLLWGHALTLIVLSLVISWRLMSLCEHQIWSKSLPLDMLGHNEKIWEL